MKYTIVIEEIISQEFEIEADSKEDAKALAEKMYKVGDLVLEPGNLLSVEFRV